MATQESLREIVNTFAVGMTTVHRIVAKVLTAEKRNNLIDASILLQCMIELQTIFKSMQTLLIDG